MVTPNDGTLEKEVIRLSAELAVALHTYLTQRLGIEMSIKDEMLTLGGSGDIPINDDMHNLIIALAPQLTKIVAALAVGQPVEPCLLCTEVHLPGLVYLHEYVSRN